MSIPSPSDPTAPIAPARFAAALKDLSIASLHLKVLELRNALSHLAHSNAQLRPFADGTETSLDPPGQPDPDCVEAIAENEVVMLRMHQRIELVKAEVLGRGASLRVFEDEFTEVADDEPGAAVTAVPLPEREEGSWPLTNGVNGGGSHDTDANTILSTTRTSLSISSTTGNPWTDGTFQMGTIRNGELHTDTEPPRRPNGTGMAGHIASTSSNDASQATNGGRLTDDELRRLLEIRLAEDAGADEEGGGLHL